MLRVTQRLAKEYKPDELARFFEKENQGDSKYKNPLEVAAVKIMEGKLEEAAQFLATVTKNNFEFVRNFGMVELWLDIAELFEKEGKKDLTIESYRVAGKIAENVFEKIEIAKKVKALGESNYIMNICSQIEWQLRQLKESGQVQDAAEGFEKLSNVDGKVICLAEAIACYEKLGNQTKQKELFDNAMDAIADSNLANSGCGDALEILERNANGIEQDLIKVYRYGLKISYLREHDSGFGMFNREVLEIPFRFESANINGPIVRIYLDAFQITTSWASQAAGPITERYKNALDGIATYLDSIHDSKNATRIRKVRELYEIRA